MKKTTATIMILALAGLANHGLAQREPDITYDYVDGEIREVEIYQGSLAYKYSVDRHGEESDIQVRELIACRPFVIVVRTWLPFHVQRPIGTSPDIDLSAHGLSFDFIARSEGNRFVYKATPTTANNSSYCNEDDETFRRWRVSLSVRILGSLSAQILLVAEETLPLNLVLIGVHDSLEEFPETQNLTDADGDYANAIQSIFPISHLKLSEGDTLGRAVDAKGYDEETLLEELAKAQASRFPDSHVQGIFVNDCGERRNDISACGIAQVGGKTSLSVINQECPEGQKPVLDCAEFVYLHELGHNFGLYHPQPDVEKPATLHYPYTYFASGSGLSYSFIKKGGEGFIDRAFALDVMASRGRDEFQTGISDYHFNRAFIHLWVLEEPEATGEVME